MTLKELEKIILQGECETVEFKNSFNTQAIETLVAFANFKGGAVYIGVSDIGKITGVSVNSETIQLWINEIKTKTEPSIISDTEIIKIKDKVVVKISISEFPVKPIAVKGRYYIRKNNSNHLLTPNEISDIYMQSMQLSWDSYLYQNAAISDLDLSKVLLFIHKVNGVKRFYLEENEINALEKLGLIREGKPTNAAMILFSKANLRYNVHIGRFKSSDLIIADKMISGNLYDVLEESMREIISHLRFAFEITGKTTSRTEIAEYPLDAIRELMVNALVHRDYRSPIDIQIKIFDQSISVFNPSGLFGNLTIEDLKTDNYRASTRNKLIAEAFYLTKDIEKYGSGFIRIRKAITDYSTMKFEYKEIANGFLAELNYSIQKISTKDGTKDGTKEPAERKMLLITEILKESKTSTIDDISQLLNIPRRTIVRYIEQLKKDNKIVRKGGRKSGHWELII